jgi:hypothetical protein
MGLLSIFFLAGLFTTLVMPFLPLPHAVRRWAFLGGWAFVWFLIALDWAVSPIAIWRQPHPNSPLIGWDGRNLMLGVLGLLVVIGFIPVTLSVAINSLRRYFGRWTTDGVMPSV